MKVRLKFANSGTFYGLDGVGLGDVVEIPDDDAEHLIRRGQVERVEPERVVERAVASEEVETTALTTENVSTPVKRAPGRPRKDA